MNNFYQNGNNPNMMPENSTVQNNAAQNGAAQNGGNFTAPPEESFNTEAMRGSMQQILADNIGEYAVVEFLIGTQNLVKREGILYTVGRSFVVLYDDLSGRYMVCDIFSVKFVTFFAPGRRPR